MTEESPSKHDIAEAGTPPNSTPSIYQNLILKPLDNAWISPNRLVTIRAWVSLSIASILAFSENLGLWLEAWLMLLYIASLVADRVDGDLARHTNQCSKEWEILDSGADKIVVYGSFIMFLISLSSKNPELYNYLISAVWVLGFSDLISQWLRWIQDNMTALNSCWKAPSSEEERKTYEYEQSSAWANIWGKLKTGTTMTSLCLALEWVSWMHQDIKTLLVGIWVGVSWILSTTSLYKKMTKN